MPPTVAVTGWAIGVGAGESPSFPSIPPGFVWPSPVAYTRTYEPTAAGLLAEFKVPSWFTAAPFKDFAGLSDHFQSLCVSRSTWPPLPSFRLARDECIGPKFSRCDVYDLIAARQPERGVSTRDRAELHSGKPDQTIVILPLATAVVKSFLPDQQPFVVLGPVKRADRSFALVDSAVVIDRADVDLDLEPADLPTLRSV